MADAPPTRRRATRLLPVLLSVLLSALFGPGHARPAAAGTPTLVDEAGRHPNVLLVTVDTLRADHLGAYGYERETSPEFDRLASEGVLFADAITPVPTTAPALASLLTSRHPDAHGVRENFGELPSEMQTIGEAFAAAGYSTAGFFGNGAIKNGFGQGLDRFEPFKDHWFFNDRAGTSKAIDWLESAREPWFLWIHFMDPHGPYNSSPPERSAGFTYPETPGLTRELPRVEQNHGIGVLPKYQQLPDQARVVDYVRRYDGEIAGTDLEIGKLRRALEKSKQLTRTLVVVTADHGESLGEDDYFFQHGGMLNEPSVRVPLLLRHPKLPAGVKTKTPASIVDVFPTLTALAGLPAPAGAVGRDLSGTLTGDPNIGQVVRVSYTVTPSRQTAVRRGRFELRGTPRRNKAADDFAKIELFDTSTTPPTRLPAGHEPAVRAELEPLLRRAARDVRENATAPRVPTEDEQKRLRALGYID